MPFKLISNFANRSTDWRNRVDTVRSTTVAAARRRAIRNASITYFVFCNREVNFPSHGEFFPGDAIFFKGVPEYSEEAGIDVYMKDFFNVAYFDSKCPKYNDSAGWFDDVGFYRVGAPTKDREFFDIAVLFAANIQGPDSHSPKLVWGPTIEQILQRGDVKKLQQRGIAVLLGILGNHQQAHWSCFSRNDPKAIEGARDFANQCVQFIKKYGVDGIDIDDEYYRGPRYEESIVIATSAIREALDNDRQLRDEDIVISKALCRDGQCDDIGGAPPQFCFNAFKAEWKGKTLAQHLTYGWEMRYQQDTVTDGADHRLAPYTKVGLNKNQLALGVSNEDSSNRTRPDFVRPWAEEIKKLGYGGMMLFETELPRGGKNGGAIKYVNDIATAFYSEESRYAGPDRLGCWA